MIVRPRIEPLESRDLKAAGIDVALADGVLGIVGSNRADVVRVTLDLPDVVVVANGQSFTFSAGDVASLDIRGGDGDDSLVNLTNLGGPLDGGNGDDYIQSGVTLGVGGDNTIVGGNGDDILFDTGGTNAIDGGNGRDHIWGFGADTLIGGNGDDTIYNIVGSGSIDGGHGDDRIITNANFTVIADDRDRPVVVFKARAETVALEDGVLYFAGDPADNKVVIVDNGDGTITTTYTDSGGTRTDTFNKSDITQFAGVLGAGNDSVLNATDIDAVFYGASGDDVFSGGSGDDLFKGGSGDDILTGGDGSNDLTGDGGSDVLDGSLGSDVIRAGFDAQDIAIVSGDDTLIGTTLTTIGTPGSFF